MAWEARIIGQEERAAGGPRGDRDQKGLRADNFVAGKDIFNFGSLSWRPYFTFYPQPPGFIFFFSNFVSENRPKPTLISSVPVSKSFLPITTATPKADLSSSGSLNLLASVHWSLSLHCSLGDIAV